MKDVARLSGREKMAVSVSWWGSLPSCHLGVRKVMGKLLGVVPVWGCAGNHRLGGRALSRGKADTGAWTVNLGVHGLRLMLLRGGI